jgi:hypothetical protein
MALSNRLASASSALAVMDVPSKTITDSAVAGRLRGERLRNIREVVI